jgi:YHS domain-containing protein
MKILLSLLLILTLAGCGAMSSQNPGGAYSPANAHQIEGSSRVMLKGHDVVSYFTRGTHAMGKSEFASEYSGLKFWFASAEHKALFDKEPAKYLPAFGGYCANGIVYGIPWGGDADAWVMQDGKLLIFGGAASKAGFLLEPQKNLQLAEKYWKEEVAGNHSFWQRTKRLVFRVPHYKTGAEIDALVKAKQSK